MPLCKARIPQGDHTIANRICFLLAAYLRRRVANSNNVWKSSDDDWGFFSIAGDLSIAEDPSIAEDLSIAGDLSIAEDPSIAVMRKIIFFLNPSAKITLFDKRK